LLEFQQIHNVGCNNLNFDRYVALNQRNLTKIYSRENFFTKRIATIYHYQNVAKGSQFKRLDSRNEVIMFESTFSFQVSISISIYVVLKAVNRFKAIKSIGVQIYPFPNMKILLLDMPHFYYTF